MNLARIAIALLALILNAQEGVPVAKSKDAHVCWEYADYDQKVGLAIPCPAQLQAKITVLEAQLAKANADLDASRQTIVAEHAACWTDDLGILNTRYVASVAQKKAAALSPKPPAAKEDTK